MKKLALISAVAALLSVPLLANAATAGVGFDSININGMSLPAGTANVGTMLSRHYAADGELTYGSGNHMNFERVQVGAGKRIPFDSGMVYAGLMGGYERLGYSAGHLSAAYAGADVRYTYPLNRDIAVTAGGGFGRDFATSATADKSTVGGLFYEAGASLNFAHVGPGVLDVSFDYQHLPISMSHDLHLNTETYGIGYHIDF